MSARSPQDMRAAQARFDRRLSEPNTFKVSTYGPGWCTVEALLKITDQAKVIKTTVLVTNVRGHGTHGERARYGFRLAEDSWAVESGTFVDEDGKPVDLPRMGMVLTNVPSTCAWIKVWDAVTR